MTESWALTEQSLSPLWFCACRVLVRVLRVGLASSSSGHNDSARVMTRVSRREASSDFGKTLLLSASAREMASDVDTEEVLAPADPAASSVTDFVAAVEEEMVKSKVTSAEECFPGVWVDSLAVDLVT